MKVRKIHGESNVWSTAFAISWISVLIALLLFILCCYNWIFALVIRFLFLSHDFCSCSWISAFIVGTLHMSLIFRSIR